MGARRSLSRSVCSLGRKRIVGGDVRVDSLEQSGSLCLRGCILGDLDVDSEFRRESRTLPDSIPIVTTRQTDVQSGNTRRLHSPGRSNGTGSLVPFRRHRPPQTSGGSAPALPFRGLLSVYSRCGLHARQVAIATPYTEGFNGFRTSTAASIATGWSEPVPGRVCLSLWTIAFPRRTE
jgi:hypothetical protein